jgi:hypothetical protein
MRPDGFPVADVDVRILLDARVLRAVRSAGADAVVAYIAVLTASWADGERVLAGEAIDALPRVYIGDPDAVVAALVDVGLLDSSGRIPAATWDSWFGPAADRREGRRERGRAGGLKSGAVRRSRREADGEAQLEPTVQANGKPSGTLPTDRPPDAATSVAAGGRSSAAPARGGAAPDDREPVLRVTPAADETVACSDYVAHRFDHVRRGSGFVCIVCTGEDFVPAMPASDDRPSFRDRIAAHGGPAF